MHELTDSQGVAKQQNARILCLQCLRVDPELLCTAGHTKQLIDAHVIPRLIECAGPESSAVQADAGWGLANILT